VLPEGSDETIEITPSIPKPRQKKALEDSPTRKTKADAKARRLEHHPLLFGVEEHLRKTRDVKDGEFLRPYKRIQPDLISSEAALFRALSIADDLYLALDKQGYRVHIAPPTDELRRIQAVCDGEQLSLAIAMPATIDGEGFQAEIEGGEMRRGGYAGLAEDGRCQQPTEPGRVLQHAQNIPGIESDDSLQHRRQIFRLPPPGALFIERPGGIRCRAAVSSGIHGMDCAKL